MGIPFFSSLVYDYLIQSIDNLKQINLTDQYVIIDGNSFMHFIYKTIVMDDKKKQASEKLTRTPFGYDGCWKIFREPLSLLKEKCSNVIVVFDGIIKSNSYQRPPPYRPSGLYSVFDGKEEKRLPSLLRHEFLIILRQLKIKIIVARGEADPVIVGMAEKEKAYVVADDSDYHLYQLSQGFVSLRYLNLKTLIGPSFQLADIFGHIDEAGVALWATVIANEFVIFDKLKTSCPINSVGDRKNFRLWLEKTEAKADKCEWTTAQLSVLRFIQKEHTNVAYNQLIEHVLQDDRSQFDQIMTSYTNIQQELPLSTQNGKQLLPVIEERYINGELDRTLIDVLINGKLSTSCEDLSLVHFRLLLPICRILLRWNYQNEETAGFNSTITYKEQEYDPFAMIKNEDIPLLTDVSNLPKNDQRNYVLYCIHFALQFQGVGYWNEVNEDYILWLSLLKLWFHEQENRTDFVEQILLALIVSFLKHVLLDTYDDYERHMSNEQLSGPFLQYSPQQLKNKFTLEKCAILRDKMDRYSATILLKEPIISALHEVEQLYDHLSIINQFFGYPLPMPTPHECISQLTYRLAVVFTTSKNIFEDISCLFQEHQFLVDMTKEIRAFIRKC